MSSEVACPKCGSKDYAITKIAQFAQCLKCEHQYRVTHITVNDLRDYPGIEITTKEMRKLLGNANRLGRYMEQKLRENAHKTLDGLHPDDQRGMPLHNLIGRVHEELSELEDGILSKESPYAVWREAADVANFAMMVAMRYEKEYNAKTQFPT